MDLAENLLALARSKAQGRGLTNIEFRSGDMTQLPFDDGSFDVVVCVFGIFFVPDMEVGLRELKRVLRSGGKLAITTWGPRFFEPASTAFWESVRDVRPDLYKDFNPWDRISEVEAVRSLLSSVGFEEIEAVAESGTQIANASTSLTSTSSAATTFTRSNPTSSTPPRRKRSHKKAQKAQND